MTVSFRTIHMNRMHFIGLLTFGLLAIIPHALCHAQGYWWQSPQLKYVEEMAEEAHGTSPHYWSFGGPSTTDSTLDQTYLYTQDSSSNANFCQYAVAELREANNPDDVTHRWATFHIDGRPKGCSQFGNRLVIGNGGELNFPFTSYSQDYTLDDSWEEMLEADIYPDCDTLNFNHDGTHLYTNHYLSDSGSRQVIHRYLVTGDLDVAGQAFTRDASWQDNGTFTTSVSRLRNFTVNYIGGKDLIYYGEGSGNPVSVYVLDPESGEETLLVEEIFVPGEVDDSDIVNIKIAGIAAGDPHLYVMGNISGVKIYKLAPDGMSVENNGEPVKVIYNEDLNTICGTDAFLSHCRAFLVTDDQQFAFLSGHNANANIFVIQGDPDAAVQTWLEH